MYVTNLDIFDNYQQMKEDKNLLIENLEKKEKQKRRYNIFSN